MKKILAVLALTLVAVPAMAQHHGYHGHHGHWHHRGGPSPWVWVAPTLIGGVIGYEIARNQPPVVVQQQPVIVQQPPVVYQPQSNCGPWVETQNQDGTITRTRTCNQ